MSAETEALADAGPSLDLAALTEVIFGHVGPLTWTSRTEELPQVQLAKAILASDWLTAHTAAAEARLGEAVKDLCWRAVRYGETDDGDTAYYLVTKGTMHRLVVAAQNAGVPATFRADDTKVIDDIAEAETRMVQAVETVLADWSPTYLRDDIDAASEVASTMAAELRAALDAAREAAARVEGGA